jgi:hypothetical protein
MSKRTDTHEYNKDKCLCYTCKLRDDCDSPCPRREYCLGVRLCNKYVKRGE